MFLRAHTHLVRIWFICWRDHMERPERETYTVAGWGRVWKRGGATTIGRILNNEMIVVLGH